MTPPHTPPPSGSGATGMSTVRVAPRQRDRPELPMSGVQRPTVARWTWCGGSRATPTRRQCPPGRGAQGHRTGWSRSANAFGDVFLRDQDGSFEFLDTVDGSLVLVWPDAATL